MSSTVDFNCISSIFSSTFEGTGMRLIGPYYVNSWTFFPDFAVMASWAAITDSGSSSILGSR